MIEISLDLIWGISASDVRKQAAEKHELFPRWKFFPVIFNKRTVEANICIGIMYSFNIAE